MPCTTPGHAAADGRAAGRLHADQARRAGSSAKPEKMPMALEPPPTQATTTSGSPPVRARHCSRASSPMTRWNSRTIHG